MNEFYLHKHSSLFNENVDFLIRRCFLSQNVPNVVEKRNGNLLSTFVPFVVSLFGVVNMNVCMISRKTFQLKHRQIEPKKNLEENVKGIEIIWIGILVLKSEILRPYQFNLFSVRTMTFNMILLWEGSYLFSQNIPDKREKKLIPCLIGHRDGI